jgi:hypothetical protein
MSSAAMNGFLDYMALPFVWRTLRKRGKGVWTFSYLGPHHLEHVNRSSEARKEHMFEWNWIGANVITSAPFQALPAECVEILDRLDPTTHVLLVWSVCLDSKRVASPDEPDCIFRSATIEIAPVVEELARIGKGDPKKETAEEERDFARYQHQLALRNRAMLSCMAAGRKLRRCVVCDSDSRAKEGPVGEPRPLRLCGGCRCVAYCGEAHQRQHWKATGGGHKLVCESLRAHRRASVAYLKGGKDEWLAGERDAARGQES